MPKWLEDQCIDKQQEQPLNSNSSLNPQMISQVSHF